MMRKLDTYDVAIVGGSIAGLMHGVVLGSLGKKVIIFESRKEHELRAEAAGLSLGPHAQQLLRKYVASSTTMAIQASCSQILSPMGDVLNEIPPAFSVTTSTWNIVFDQLKEKFIEKGKSEPKRVYEAGIKVTKFEDTGPDTPIKLYYRDESLGPDKSVEAAMVIAADGARSTILGQLQPDLQPKYAGYVAWRGFVPEIQTPYVLRGALEGKLLFAPLEGHYIIAYLTPGPNGSTIQGERLLDWCWYCPLEENTPEFNDVMTDTLGHRHNKTVPRGRLRKEVWEKQCKKYMLPAGWSEIIKKAELPFVTAVTSFEGTVASFCDQKILLVGEAFTQFRPHLGLSCNLAAVQALALAEVLNGEKSMGDWEEFSMQYAQEFATRSIAMGQFGLTGSWPEGYTPLYLNKGS